MIEVATNIGVLCFLKPLEHCMQQEFAIALCSQNRRIDEILLPGAKLRQSLPHLLDRRQLDTLVAYDPALSDMPPPPPPPGLD